MAKRPLIQNKWNIVSRTFVVYVWVVTSSLRLCYMCIFVIWCVTRALVYLLVLLGP